jgi:hypothetical protein
MPVVARAVGRIFLVPLGFLLATAVAVAVLVTLGLERVTQSVHGRSWDEQALGQMLDVLADAVALTRVATIVPAILVVLVGEVARIRSALFYIVGGGIALAALPFLKQSGGLGTQITDIGLGWQVFATAGFAGGAIYWLIAGRRA